MDAFCKRMIVEHPDLDRAKIIHAFLAKFNHFNIDRKAACNQYDRTIKKKCNAMKDDVTSFLNDDKHTMFDALADSNQDLHDLSIKFRGGQMSIQVCSSSTLFDVREKILQQEFQWNGNFFFQLGNSCISKKMEQSYSVDAIVEEGISISLISRSSLGGNALITPTKGTKAMRSSETHAHGIVTKDPTQVKESAKGSGDERVTSMKQQETLQSDTVGAVGSVAADDSKGTGKKHRYTFKQRLQHLKAYKEKHGHVNVTFDEDKGLYQFIASSKHTLQHPEKKTKMSAEKIAGLSALGFSWANVDNVGVHQSTSEKNETNALATVGENPSGFSNVVDKAFSSVAKPSSVAEVGKASGGANLNAGSPHLDAASEETVKNASQEFIARVKQTLADANHPNIYRQFLDLALKVKKEEVDTITFARRVLSLFKGYNELIMGFFSLLPDEQLGGEVQDVGNQVSMIKYVVAVTLEVKPQDQVAHISNLLVRHISKILETQSDHSSLGSILHSLHLEDPRFVSVVPTVETFRAVLSACYQMSGRNPTPRIDDKVGHNFETNQFMIWDNAIKVLLGIDHCD